MGDEPHNEEVRQRVDPAPPAGRAVHGLLTMVTGVGLVTSFWIAWHHPTGVPAGSTFEGGFPAGWEHIINQPVHFTFISAAMVFATSLALTIRPQIGNTRRWGFLFHTVRLSGIVCMVLSGLLWNLLLRTPDLLDGVKLVNDSIYHLLLPVLVPLVWLMGGPHGRITWKIVLLSPLPPTIWFILTLLRGPGLDWYPYSILDVPRLGYPTVLGIAAGVLVAFLAVAALIWLVDRMMDRNVGRLEIRPGGSA